MRWDVITLFPEFFAPLVQSGINRRAFEQGRLQLHLWNPPILPTANTAASMTARSVAALAWS